MGDVDVLVVLLGAPSVDFDMDIVQCSLVSFYILRGLLFAVQLLLCTLNEDK